MDKHKRPFYPVNRHANDVFSLSSIPTVTTKHNLNQHRRRRRLALSNKGLVVFTASLLMICLLFIRRQTAPPTHSQQLRDQPTYATPTHCNAKLCNPSNRCSVWTPSHYDWTALVQQGVYRDLATIQVSDPGCVVSLQVEGEQPDNNSRWVPILAGQVVDCLQEQCRNVVALDIKNDINTLLTQLESSIDKDPDQEMMVTRPVNSTLDQQVTLISQFSVNRLDVFTKVMDAWPGPISIAIYLTEHDDIKTIKMYFADPANVELYQRVSMTIIKPSSTDPDRLRYPINHLRNLAIMASSTPFVFVMDADFVPSITLYNTTQSILPSAAATALIVPCFAIHEEHDTLPLPTSMEEVKKLVDQGIAYVTDPGAGHGPTLGKERALGSSSSSDTISYEVCYESQWEPYYIVPRNAPLYDARFKNQGGDKQSHALQLNAERYQFLVLAHEFMIHKDHPKMVWPGGGFAKAQKEQASWNYFGGFMREMESIYGYNVRWPHGCSALAVGWQEQRRNTLGMAIGAI
ncbi:glycosyl-transferase for dystroglycan-domain-containing protein [Chlamydoabsidia padenii]|nr:glycosyl-transferase for dystroglycan-domain-containing protein [Chlamydoabsidia padenii]